MTNGARCLKDNERLTCPKNSCSGSCIESIAPNGGLHM